MRVRDVWASPAAFLCCMKRSFSVCRKWDDNKFCVLDEKLWRRRRRRRSRALCTHAAHTEGFCSSHLLMSMRGAMMALRSR